MTRDQTQNPLSNPVVTTEAVTVVPPYLAYVGINEAARLVGKAKQQIYRDIEAGKLSWNLDTLGKKRLQVADLDRVYTLKPKTETSHIFGLEHQKLPVSEEETARPNRLETVIELARLQERLAAKEEALQKAEAQIRDLQQNRDSLLDQTKRLLLLLPTPFADPAKTDPPPAAVPWYKRIFQ